jgi:hypothetical protein
LITVENVSKWALDDLAPYMTDVVTQMGRLAKRFPEDCTTASIFHEIYSGNRALWLIREGETFVAMAMSHIRTINATGAKIATLTDLAGDRVAEYAEQLCAAVEAWADENQCVVKEVQGREGWKPLLARHGYRPHTVIYRKTANGRS